MSFLSPQFHHTLIFEDIQAHINFQQQGKRGKQMMFNQAFDKNLPRGDCDWAKKGPMTG